MSDILNRISFFLGQAFAQDSSPSNAEVEEEDEWIIKMEITEKNEEIGESSAIIKKGLLYGEPVAVKFYSKLSDRFRQEVDILKNLWKDPESAQYIIKFMGYDPEQCLLVTKLYQTDLGKLISREILPLSKSIRYCYQISKGIEFLLEKSITHRDIKPSNIFLEDDEENVKIGDFGISKLKMTATDYSESFGTMNYRPPEWSEKHKWTENSDIYSLGVTIYEISIGRDKRTVPIHEDSFSFPQYSDRDVILISPLQELIKKCCKKDPNERPPISEVVNKLNELVKLVERIERYEEYIAEEVLKVGDVSHIKDLLNSNIAKHINLNKALENASKAGHSEVITALIQHKTSDFCDSIEHLFRSGYNKEAISAMQTKTIDYIVEMVDLHISRKNWKMCGILSNYPLGCYLSDRVYQQFEKGNMEMLEELCVSFKRTLFIGSMLGYYHDMRFFKMLLEIVDEDTRNEGIIQVIDKEMASLLFQHKKFEPSAKIISRALSCQVSNGRWPIVKLIMDSNSTIDMIEFSKWNGEQLERGVWAAIMFGSDRFVHLLLDDELYIPTESSVNFACSHNRQDLLSRFLSNYFGNFPREGLRIAVHNKFINIVKTLLEKQDWQNCGSVRSIVSEVSLLVDRNNPDIENLLQKYLSDQTQLPTCDIQFLLVGTDQNFAVTL